jgi:predicted metal-dependent hydrolase
MDRRTAKGPLSRPLTRQLALFDSRFIRLGERFVEYRFVRAARRTLKVTVDASGLSVAAPLRAPFSAVEAFLRDKEAWILAKIEEWARAPRPARVRVETGATLPLHGQPVALEVREAGRSLVAREAERIVVRAPGPRRAARALVRWLKAEALASLTPRTAHYAALLGVPPPRVALSNARSQWGVCVEDGRVRLNWRLVHLPAELADYVVAHEVAHLVEMNHSKRFWSLVGTLYPAWREARERLELAGAAIPIIGEDG